MRILVADDQASVREGLVLLLDLFPDIDVVGSAANGAELLDLVEEHHPDAVVLDLHMPVMDGVETSARLTAEHPEVAIVILTTYSDDASVLAALRAGAKSYLTKDADRTDIARALHAAAQGMSVLDPTVQAALLSAAGTPTRRTDLPDGLTRREAEILVRIAQGASNSDLADELVLSTHTIKSHINRIFAKTGSADRAAATRYAHEQGLC